MFNVSSSYLRWKLISPLLCFIMSGQGQNLVFNSSFEDENICESRQGCSPAAWFFVRKAEYSGYVTNEIAAAAGSRWLALIAGNRMNNRERHYWQTVLMSPLKKGEKYKISLSIHGFGSEAIPNPDDVGLYFIPEMVYSNSDTVIQPDFFLNFSVAKKLIQKSGWVRLETEYEAEGNDQIMMIGNFSKENSSEIARRRGGNSKYYGFLVDDIEVIPLSDLNLPHSLITKDSIYSVVKRHPSDYMLKPKFQAISPNNSSLKTTSDSMLSDILILRNLFFDFGLYKVNDESELDQYRHVFEMNKRKRLIILGFTDDVGTKSANLELSRKRAEEIGRLITKKFRIPADLILPKGMGISRDSSDKSGNRRVEVHFID